MKKILGALMVAALGSVSAATLVQAQETLIVDTVFQLKTADPARSFEPTASLWLHAVYENLLTFADGDTTPGDTTLHRAIRGPGGQQVWSQSRRLCCDKRLRPRPSHQ
jgi:hypothetical protein